ncbi:MAG: sugar phosphate isomerase/epimerase [Alicyclobacillus herbarius]|uniref:sugar phosphate isomerase/epimerase family protein n=1 Tax=Alicyclobacillus herbarius TaxID=122960 RepID=UPI002354BC39|nr:sugar phosphate isomerase/epimerase [Alicyclobacillus herbarius]MCL6633805.1 sugar phosphate isomerase/epimerase [Alicyclobacillus herbarius]
MKLGVNTVLFGGYDLQTAVRYIKFTGYQGVELASIPGMVEHLTDTAADANLREIRELVEDAGLELYAVEAATDILVAENRERSRRVFERAQKLGIPVVTIGSSGVSDDEAKFEASLRAIEDLALAAGDLGVKFALKIHYGQSVYNTQTALRLMEEVRHPALGLNYDPTHVGRVGDDPVAALLALKDYIIHIHIRDTLLEQLKIAPPPLQVPGRGTTPLAEIVRTVLEIGYQGPVDLEIIGADRLELPEVVAIAAESRGYLSRLFEEVEAQVEAQV